MALLGRVIFGLGGESLNGRLFLYNSSGIDDSSGSVVQRQRISNEHGSSSQCVQTC